MKKKLFTLLVCAFAWISVNAWTVDVSGSTVTIDCGNDGLPQNWSSFGDYCDDILDAKTLIVTGNVGQYDLSCFNQGKSQTASNGKTGFQATTVDFSNAHFDEKYEDGVGGPFTFYEYAPNSSTKPKYSPSTTTAGAYVEAADGKYIKHDNVRYKVNGMRFDYFVNVKTPILSNYVESICQNCINNLSTVETFTIPASVKFIAAGAVDDSGIKSIIIPSNVEYIQSEAFRNADTNSLIDVTVESISTVCAKGGFLKDITVGQTDAGYGNYAVLHFPEGAEEYFINETHPLTQEASLNYGFFQAWLDQHYSKSGNGWQEFINSTPAQEREELDKPVVLRTFSDNVAHYVPLCYRAYIVNGIEGNSTDGYTLKLQETYAIPANTGVIIYGEAQTGSFALPILSGSSWANTPYDRTEQFVTSNNKKINLQNYLVANCTLNGAKIGPYELGSDGKVAERNFVMGPYKKTDIYNGTSEDYVAFFRAKTMTPGKNKAHLKLPSTIKVDGVDQPYYSEPKGAELIVLNQNDFRKTEWNYSFTDTGNWGSRNGVPSFQAKSFGEPFEDEYEATGISNVKNENTDDAAIFNLQGVKVANPVKGVYVKAGKKIIIK